MSNIDKVSVERDAKLEELFGKIPLETEVLVRLPSEGKFYGTGKPEVLITPIKFEDEKQLASSIKNNLNPINIILSKCVKGVDINSLLLIDKLFLLLKVREISYGEQYPAAITCPHCSTVSEVSINLNDLIVNYIPADLDDPREINLPKLKKKVRVRFPRVSDEIHIATQEQVYNNIWRFVVSVDGITDPVFINKAIPKMHIMDVKFILGQIMRNDLGLNPKFIFGCDSCGKESELEVPINENFFSVT
jgi:transcription termination factor NusB